VTHDDPATFHRHTAKSLMQRYADSAQAPESWRETTVWHWELGEGFEEAASLALEVVEVRITRIDFPGARVWVERALTNIGRLPAEQQLGYELRACTLALAVLEFGGQYREGLEYARRMLRAARGQRSVEAEARAQLAIGRMQRELGQLVAAETMLNKARALAERDELSELETEVRLHLAKVHQLQGRHMEALQELQLARATGEQADDRLRLARVFTGIGDIYRVLGATDQSQTFYIRALNLEQGSGNLLGQAILKDKLALAALDQGRLGEALASAEESLAMRERLRDLVGQARSYTVLGTILGRTQRYDRALAYLQRARDLQEQIQNSRGQGIALLHLGDVSRSMGRFDSAHGSYASALELARRDSDQVGLARALERIGDLHFDEGRRDQANMSWGQALRLREQLRHSDEVTALRSRIKHGPPRKSDQTNR
jgi:tetratricopeptide (TPR) repeat protein